MHTENSRFRILVVLLSFSLTLPSMVLAHGGGGHIDVAPSNHLTDQFSREASSWFVNINTFAKWGVNRSKVKGNSHEGAEEGHDEDAGGHDEDGHEAESGELVSHGHDHDAQNSILFTPSIGYQLAPDWALVGSGSIDFANAFAANPESRTRQVDFHDPSIGLIQTFLVNTRTDLMTSLSLLVPVSLESRTVSRSVGFAGALIGQVQLMPRWSATPFITASHYVGQDTHVDAEQAQTEYAVGTMAKYSMRKWNTFFQAGGRYEEGLNQLSRIRQMIHIVPLRADVALSNWSMSLYPEVRYDIRNSGRSDTFMIVEAIYSMSGPVSSALRASTNSGSHENHGGHNH